jgi:putative membrane protein
MQTAINDEEDTHLNTLLTPEDEKRISAAIAEAEATTAGEIVAIVAPNSSSPAYFALLWAALAALLVPWPLIYLTWWTMQSVFALQVLVFVVLAALLNLEPFSRRIVPAAVAKRWAHQRAVEQFLAQNMHTTAGRTGVLIFVSVAERYAEILADTQINARVPPGTWKVLVDELTRQIGAGRPADGFVAAIASAGKHLATHFPPDADNPNELPNHLIVLGS